MDKPEMYVQKLIETAGNKKNLLDDLNELTRQQTEAINNEDIGRLQSLVDQKQEKINKINCVDEEFSVNFKKLKDILGVESLDDVENPSVWGLSGLKKIVGDIIRLVEQISELEKSNSQLAKKLLNKIGSEIKLINQGKKISNAYNTGNGMRQSYHFDSKK